MKVHGGVRVCTAAPAPKRSLVITAQSVTFVQAGKSAVVRELSAGFGHGRAQLSVNLRRQRR